MVRSLNLQQFAWLCVVSSESGRREEEEGELGPYPRVLAVELLTRHQAQIGQWSLSILSPFLLRRDWIWLLRSVRIRLLSTR